ncbi:hypothetical protein ISF_04515 [Cordyceps fumosorosea ARSEF 2679]|uniref:Uncharacterized protein n=1 Tax=Cordyceps fumosorosea (strain ARSEF 2679) TaxID=1081104 RepID=A0A167WHS3_CORFA|nr:hypothetical protein ISF_04515 [Cordyceps fumosorosea ARSEF 2679]OAA63806.1 hypothetical protein ISF_04515 [Cordyceps fumosorosea ARSEF 2679]
MDKVDILTASRVEPLSQHHHATIISRMGPTLAYAVHLHNIIGSLSVFLCWRAYLLASISLAGAYWAARILAFHALVATKVGAFHGATASIRAAAAVWDMKTTRMLRDKLFYEFALFVLGAGNGLFLLVLWPGWIVIGGTSFVLWQVCG